MAEQCYSLSFHRRLYKRFRVDTCATLIVDKDLESSVILKDLSLRGASVVGSQPFKVNDKIEIIFSNPFSGNSVCKKAKTVWCRKIEENFWQAGLDFGLDNKAELA